ncbi:MAG: polyphosphate kinase 2 family protein [Verrucomicrobia bacterium]|nr:polyphosphate kinase 2 family protein [Verrucomicrobiota bacterium]
MKKKEFIDRCHEVIAAYTVTDGKDFRLKDCRPDDTGPASQDDKPRARELLEQGVEILAELQDVLYAQDQWSVLLIFQAMDAAGKDGAIKHVMSGVNPQGCQVFSFKAPSAQDLKHDYLWRCLKCLPERGRIGIFNRSYYEETLVVRVHPEILGKQKIPQELIKKKIWEQRFDDIRNVEKYLSHNGVVIRKFFLNVSADEQKKRFLDRLDNPAKNWKFSAADAHERGFWKDYMNAYEETIANTASEEAPWYVVPADNKWFTRVIVAAVVVDALASLDLDYPKVSDAQKQDLELAKQKLSGENKE